MEYFKGIGSLSSVDFGGAFGETQEKPTQERPNAPGLMSDVRRATGQFVAGAGSTLRDLGAEDVGGAVEQYGADVVRRNPSEIQSFDDVLSRPFTTAREAVGEVAPQVGLGRSVQAAVSGDSPAQLDTIRIKIANRIPLSGVEQIIAQRNNITAAR